MNKILTCVFVCLLLGIFYNTSLAQSDISYVSSELPIATSNKSDKEKSFVLRGNPDRSSHLFLYGERGKLLKRLPVPQFSGKHVVNLEEFKDDVVLIEWWVDNNIQRFKIKEEN